MSIRGIRRSSSRIRHSPSADSICAGPSCSILATAVTGSARKVGPSDRKTTKFVDDGRCLIPGAGVRRGAPDFGRPRALASPEGSSTRTTEPSPRTTAAENVGICRSGVGSGSSAISWTSIISSTTSAKPSRPARILSAMRGLAPESWDRVGLPISTCKCPAGTMPSAATRANLPGTSIRTPSSQVSRLTISSTKRCGSAKRSSPALRMNAGTIAVASGICKLIVAPSSGAVRQRRRTADLLRDSHGRGRDRGFGGKRLRAATARWSPG